MNSFLGRASQYVYAKATWKGQTKARQPPPFYWSDRDGSLQDATGYHWPADATVSIPLDNLATPASLYFTWEAITKETWNSI